MKRTLFACFIVTLALNLLVPHVLAVAVCDYTRTSVGQTPISDMTTQTYQGLTGGLYGGGSNTRPTDLETRLAAALAGIGPGPNGKIEVVCVGDDSMDSGCRGLIASTASFNPLIDFVNATKPAAHLESWSVTGADNPWSGTAPVTVLKTLAARGIAPTDVRVAIFASSVGNVSWYLTHTFAERQALTTTNFGKAFVWSRTTLPNAALLASDIQYLDYGTDSAQPNTHAEPILGYEMSFGMQAAVLAQNQTTMPVTAWLASAWSDGVTPRSDGLVWTATTSQTTSMYQPVCGHLNSNGQGNYARPLKTALLTDPTLTFFRP